MPATKRVTLNVVSILNKALCAYSIIILYEFDLNHLPPIVPL